MTFVPIYCEVYDMKPKQSDLETTAMNVVFIADIPIKGGATNSMVELAYALQQRYGVQCTVCTAQESDLNRRLSAMGIRNIVTGHGAFLASGSQYRLKTLYNIVMNTYKWLRGLKKSVALAEESIDFDNIDIIHSNLPRNDLGILLASKHGIPHITHLRESSFEDFGCISLRKDPGKFLSDNSAALIAVSRFVKSNWCSRGIDDKKIRIIYNGVNTRNILRKSRECSGPIRVVFLGGYSACKGINDILIAAAHASTLLRGRIEINIYGQGISRRARGFIKRHKISDIVVLHGAMEDVPDHLCEYDIGLACSKAEAFGRIVLEYRAAGLAVIAANRGAFPELINDGVDGFLYDSNIDGQRLEDVLLKIVNDPHLIRSVVSCGSDVRTPEAVADEVYRLYNEVLRAREQEDQY